MFWIYILFSPTLNRFYIGQTGRLEQRIQDHAAGAAHFTKQAHDWVLVFLESAPDRRTAMGRERQIKRAKSHLTILRHVADARNQIGDAPHLALMAAKDRAAAQRLIAQPGRVPTP
jgi:putative endonuclease